MKIIWYVLLSIHLGLDALRLKVQHYFLRRRIKKLVKAQGLVLKELEILPPGVPTPRVVNIWPMEDGIDHKARGAYCVCRPRVEPRKDENGDEFWLIKHNSKEK